MAEVKLQHVKNYSPKDLNCDINYLADYTFSDTHNPGAWFWKSGQPGKWPNGKYGYTIYGDSDVAIKPEPKEGEARVAHRSPIIPEYNVEFGEPFWIQARITIYEHKFRTTLKDPNRYSQILLKSVAGALSKYVKAVSFYAMAGTEKDKSTCYSKKYFDEYIYKTDGDQNGHQFYISKDSHYNINFNQAAVMAVGQEQEKKNYEVKDHKLQKALKKVKDAFYKESHKEEVQASTIFSKQDMFANKELNDDDKNFFALLLKASHVVKQTFRDGFFDEKYKVHDANDKKLEKWNMPATPENTVITIPKASLDKLRMALMIRYPSNTPIDLNFLFDGAQVVISEYIEEDCIFFTHKEAVQFWNLPAETNYVVVRYEWEQTRDIYFEMAHTVDLVGCFCHQFFKIKK